MRPTPATSPQMKPGTRPSGLSRFIGAGSIALLVGTANPVWAQSHAAPTAGTVADAAAVLGTMPDAARAALVAGEPEYALRLLRAEFGMVEAGENNILDSSARHAYRAVFEYTLDLRLREGADGAAVDLLVQAPAWLGAVRADGARRLVVDWKNDQTPTLNSLTRRLNWYQALQRSIKPAPLDPETPITLTLIALDHIDHVRNPMGTLRLLEVADQIAPGHILWSSYRPDEQYLMRAAEQMVREQNFLATGEIYRRLIYLMAADADWFKRRYANNQLARVYALFGIAGADFAMQAAARVRQEFLEASELGRFRLLKENLRQLIIQNKETRRLPRALEGNLNLEALPLAYLIKDRMLIEKGGVLNFGPGTVVRGGGRIVLNGGQVNFNGTEDKPVIVIGLTFQSNDLAGGGIIKGSHVQFRACEFRRDPMKPTAPGALRWRIQSAYANGCRFPFDPHVDVEWTRSEFDESEITLPIQFGQGATLLPPSTAAENADTPARIPGAYVTITECLFRDSQIDDALAILADRSRFIDCQIKSWLPGALPAATPLIVNNIFIPAGELPAQISRRSALGEQANLIIFAPNENRTRQAQNLHLAKTKIWVE